MRQKPPNVRPLDMQKMIHKLNPSLNTADPSSAYTASINDLGIAGLSVCR